jgi:hypothetical protein
LGDDARAQFEIAAGQRVDRQAHLLLDEAAHLQHARSERLELLVELLGSMVTAGHRPSPSLTRTGRHRSL